MTISQEPGPHSRRNRPAARTTVALILASLSLLGTLLFGIGLRTKLDKISSEVQELRDKQAQQETDLASLKLTITLQNLEGMVDLSESIIQEIGKGFLVVGLDVSEHLTGVRISGRVINTQSVRHNNVQFKISVGESFKEFTINRISPGNSTGFNVYLPDVPPEAARFARIEYQTSSISYYTR